MLLFIGFNRIWHFTYIQLDALLCGFFRRTRLTVASTFWRYINSRGLNQARSFLKIMGMMRESFWQLSGLNYERINISIDTTVETIYGNQQGGRKGVTIDGKECAAFIETIEAQLPGCVKQGLLRADGEFLSWKSVSAAMSAGFEFIITNKGCKPLFDPNRWYRPWKRKNIQYNSCIYKPTGWDMACRFVAMRIPKEDNAPLGQPIQCALFEDDRYIYRIFCASLTGKAHKVIAKYDKRADVENLVGEAKREGLDAIPSSKFKNNYAFFQIVMLAYNTWRYMKIMAHQSIAKSGSQMQGIMTNTIRIARLKLLFIAAKAVKDGNRDKVKYSIHDTRTSAIMRFLKYLDRKRSEAKPWEENSTWPERFSLRAV